MKLTWACRLLPAVFLLALAAPVHAQSFGFPWWRDAQFQKELSLTTDQASRIDAVFQSAAAILRPKKEELDMQEAELSRLIAVNADETRRHATGRQGRDHSSQPEQDADADAAAYAPGPDA